MRRAARLPGPAPVCFRPRPIARLPIPLVPFGRASLSLYPQFVAEVEEISGRRAGYRKDGAIELLFSADAERELSTLIALHRALGLPSEPLPLDEAYGAEPGLTRRARAAAYLPYEGSVDNRALMEALLAAARATGVEILADAEAREVMIEGGRCSGVRARNGDVFGGARGDRRGRRLFRPAGGNRSQAGHAPDSRPDGRAQIQRRTDGPRGSQPARLHRSARFRGAAGAW